MKETELFQEYHIDPFFENEHPDKTGNFPKQQLGRFEFYEEDKVKEFHPYSDSDHMKQLIARSNSSFEMDFRKFLSSEYVKNRPVFFDTSIYHVLFPHLIFPPVQQVIESENARRLQAAAGVCFSLLKEKCQSCLIITLKPNADESPIIRGLVKDGYDSFTRLSVPDGFKKTWVSQIYLAVVRFTRKYITEFTKQPYSRIDVYSIETVRFKSRFVARFEDGFELTINAVSP